jgi:hypothetical protein
MDVKALREEALEETARFFLDTLGYLPDPDSEEYEEQYRRQFALAKKRHEARGPLAPAPAPAAPVIPGRDKWPELRGPPAERRWAESVRAERMALIPKKDLRDWLAQAWTTVQAWMTTREMPAPAFLRRVEAEFAEHRKRAEARRKLQAAGITADGLAELIDASNRVAAAALKDKLAEFDSGRRNIRVFETADAKVLMVLEKVVLEKTGPERTQYAIERDEGLVNDLKLFAQGQGN